MTTYIQSRIPQRIQFFVVGVALLLSGCKKFVQVDPPKTLVTEANVYNKDATAIQILTGIYADMSAKNNLTGELSALFFYAGLSADEYMLYDQTNPGYTRHYTNSLNSQIDQFWGTSYKYIFIANTAFEEINAVSSLTPAVKRQLLGEARFVRAFCLFYLVNGYGDIPVPLSTDPSVNRLLGRTPRAQVYAQIEKDLMEAKLLLSAHFLDGTLLNTTTERVRPTKWAAAALLARTYLYDGKFSLAESESDSLIASGQFKLLNDPNQVFLKNSDETIWAWQPVYNASNNGLNSGEGKLFVLPASGPNVGGSPSYPVYLSSYTLNNFEPGDLRRTDWVDSVIAGGVTYHFPYKYKAGLSQRTSTEYSIVFRLGEQYLIRAEARARQQNPAGAVADLNAIRARARAAATVDVPQPLPPLDPSITPGALYAAIEHERQSELFAEWGHRWFDLKRTPGFSDPNSTRADEVMPAVCVAKGGNWSPNWKLYPIPIQTIQNNPTMANAQNPGY